MIECPKCGAKVVRQCRCPRSDIECAEGHRFYRCLIHNVWVPGHSDHGLNTYECTCGQGNRLISDEDIKKCTQSTTPTLAEFTKGKTIEKIDLCKIIVYITFTDGTRLSFAWIEGSMLNAMGVNKDGIVIQLT